MSSVTFLKDWNTLLPPSLLHLSPPRTPIYLIGKPPFYPWASCKGETRPDKNHLGEFALGWKGARHSEDVGSRLPLFSILNKSHTRRNTRFEKGGRRGSISRKPPGGREREDEDFFIPLFLPSSLLLHPFCSLAQSFVPLCREGGRRRRKGAHSQSAIKMMYGSPRRRRRRRRKGGGGLIN